MNQRYIVISLFLFVFFRAGISQNKLELNVKLDTLHHILECNQKIVYTNVSSINLKQLQLYAWSNSFRQANTPLDTVMLENYNDSFHFAWQKDRGNIFELSIYDSNAQVKSFNYKEGSPDILIVKLNQPLYPDQKIELHLRYKVKIPSSKFTGYGKLDNGYHLKYTYILPGVYHKDKWICYSNKGYDDLLTTPFDVQVKYTVPQQYFLNSNLNQESVEIQAKKKIYQLSGSKVKQIEILISTQNNFYTIKLNKNLDLVLDFIPEISLGKVIQSVKRSLSFLSSKSLNFKCKKLFITDLHLRRNIILGLQELPIIKIFSDDFKWDLKFFKTLASYLLNEKYNFNKRKELWMYKGLLSYLEYDYIDTYYPDKNLFGTFSDWPIVNLFDLSRLKVNDKNRLLYLYMERKGYGQPISTPTDSLINANRIFTAEIKSMLGFKYLQNYTGKEVFIKSLDKLADDSGVITESNDFRKLLNKYNNNSVDWYFDKLIKSTENFDFRLTSKIVKDTIHLSIDNENNNIPFKLTTLYNNNSKLTRWYDPNTKNISLHTKNINKFQVNDNLLEYDFKDNTAYTKHKISRHWRLMPLIDIENPNYHQTYFSPYLDFKNKYDNLMLGFNFYSKPLFLSQNLNYTLSPVYSIGQKTIVGKVSFSYSSIYNNPSNPLQRVTLGFISKYLHYDYNKSYLKYETYLSIKFKPKYPKDIQIRNLKLVLQNVNNQKLVAGLRYLYQSTEKINQNLLKLDAQVNMDFIRLFVEYKYRYKFARYHFYSFRVFGGSFLYKRQNIGNEFDFNISNANDYLFEHEYLARSDTQGFLSKQTVIADGGFKIDTNDRAMNILSIGGTISIWDFIEVYADYAITRQVKNTYNTKHYYATGIRLNLVEDFLEFYFPIYSSLETEITQSDYLSKIYFVFTWNPYLIIKRLRRGFF